MSDHAMRFHCTIISLAIDGENTGERAALSLARRFGSTCRALLVESAGFSGTASIAFGQAYDPRSRKWQVLPRESEAPDPLRASERQLRRLQALANAAGMKAETALRETASVPAELRGASAEQLVILAQPADPLARQAQPFTSLRDAALRSATAVVFAPPASGASGKGILALAPEDNVATLAFARELGALTGEPVQRAPVMSLSALSGRLDAAGPPYPTLIILVRDADLDDPAALSRLAARLAVPVLVLEPGSSPTLEAD